MGRSKASTRTQPEPVAPQEPAQPAAGEPRIIRKYPNRRLYDTSASAYVTLAQVRQLVLERQPFVVHDARTGEDLTRSVLLQILLEEEASGAPMFSESMLAEMIRFYGHAMQGFMGSYLEKSIQAFLEIQARLAEHSQGFTPETWTQFMRLQSPLMQGMMGDYLEQSKKLFLQAQEQMTRQTEQMLDAFGIRR